MDKNEILKEIKTRIKELQAEQIGDYEDGLITAYKNSYVLVSEQLEQKEKCMFEHSKYSKLYSKCNKCFHIMTIYLYHNFCPACGREIEKE